MEVGRDIDVDRDPVDDETEERPATRRRPKKGDANGSSNSDKGNGRSTNGKGQLKVLLNGLRNLEKGNFATRIELTGDPLLEQLGEAFNHVAEMREQLTNEIIRISTSVGREGQMTDRASIGPVRGGWARSIE